MTTSNTAASKLKARGRFRLPDIPQREPDEVTQYDQLFHQGLSAALVFHLGNLETTLVAADRWVVPDTEFDKSRGRYPDLLVAFGVDPALYRENNGYVVSEQGKVLEVASEGTAEADMGVKREYYESLGITEYWRFDHTPDCRWHGTLCPLPESWPVCNDTHSPGGGKSSLPASPAGQSHFDRVNHKSRIKRSILKMRET